MSGARERRAARWCAAAVAALTMAVAAPAGAAEEDDEEAPMATAQLVGILTEQAYMVCTGKPEPRWVEPYWEVGFVRIELARGLDLGPYEGRMVVVEGSVLPAAPNGGFHPGNRRDRVVESSGVVVVTFLHCGLAQCSQCSQCCGGGGYVPDSSCTSRPVTGGLNTHSIRSCS